MAHSDATLVEIRRLLGADKHDAAWCTSIETAIATIGTHIEAAQNEIDTSSDPDLRQKGINLIGELIAARQKLERALEPVRSKPPSVLNTLKQALGLDDKDKTEPA